MNTRYTTHTKFFAVLLVLMLGFIATYSVAFADHHDEEGMHDDAAMASVATNATSDARLLQMQQLLALLQQVAALLTARAEMQNVHVHDDSHEHDEDDDGHSYTTLTITAEEHDGRTHIHVYEPDMDVVKFFLEDLDLSQESEIIAAVALETGISEADVTAAITFAHEEDEHEHDTAEEDEMDHEDHMDGDEDDQYDGIHIMGDGTVMLGDGTALETATVTDDGMIELEDGTVLEPAFDLR